MNHRIGADLVETADRAFVDLVASMFELTDGFALAQVSPQAAAEMLMIAVRGFELTIRTDATDWEAIVDSFVAVFVTGIRRSVENGAVA